MVSELQTYDDVVQAIKRIDEENNINKYNESIVKNMYNKTPVNICGMILGGESLGLIKIISRNDDNIDSNDLVRNHMNKYDEELSKIINEKYPNKDMSKVMSENMNEIIDTHTISNAREIAEYYVNQYDEQLSKGFPKEYCEYIVNQFRMSDTDVIYEKILLNVIIDIVYNNKSVMSTIIEISMDNKDKIESEYSKAYGYDVDIKTLIDDDAIGFINVVVKSYHKKICNKLLEKEQPYIKNKLNELK